MWEVGAFEYSLCVSSSLTEVDTDSTVQPVIDAPDIATPTESVDEHVDAKRDGHTQWLAMDCIDEYSSALTEIV